MTDTTTVNSNKYWDTRFTKNWEYFDGPAQSQFFAKIAIEHLPHWLLSQLKTQALTLADWGCAQGDGTAIWSDYISNTQITGVDFSGVAIEQAIKRYPAIHFSTENWLENKVNPKKVFDIVFSSNTLEHFNHPYDVLHDLSKRAKKAVVLAIPYREHDRIEEHFFTFSPDNIPNKLNNGFRLTWSKVVDCRTFPDSLWNGEQIILVYAESAWIDSLDLSLEHLGIEQQPIISTESIKQILLEKDNAIVKRDSALTERDRALVERDKALVERDDALALNNLITRSLSWRLTKPLRFTARLVRYGADSQNQRQLAKIIRNRYHQLPLPAQAKSFISHSYHKTIPKTIRLIRHLFSKTSSFQPPSTKPGVKHPESPDYIIWGVIDWHFRHQRPQQLALALAEKNRRVFYISPTLVDDQRAGFNVEPLDSEGKLFQIRLFCKESPNIYSNAPTLENVNHLRLSIGETLSWAACTQVISLIDHPFWYDTASVLPNSRLIYDCMDHHEGFGNNAESLVQLEKQLLNNAELTIITSSWLEETVSPYTKNHTLIRNAGEYEHFTKTPEQIYSDPSGRKVIGYYGAIAEWFDIDLVEAIARQYTDCSIVLVGADTVNAQSRLAHFDNITFTGEVPYNQLPYYLYGFDVCLLPFKITPLTLATNPVKAYEYLSAGKPILTVDLPEMRQFGELVYIAPNKDSFISTVELLINQPEPEQLIQQRKTFAAGQTWQHRVEALIEQAESTERDPKVSIVVVTFNNIEFTKLCLQSLDTYNDYAPLEIIVVDNASNDGTPKFLSEWASRHPSRKVILNDENLGFAAANNQGLHIATGEYLILLNNDTHVTPGWIRTLIQHIQRDQTIGLIGPVTNNIGNEAKIQIEYDNMDEMLIQSAAYTNRHIGQSFSIRTAAFFCVMMPRNVYESTGSLDEAFGRGFFEDDDYCRRVEQLGFRIVCAEDVFIHHHLSASFNKLKQQERQRLFEENKKIYEAKWGEWTPHELRSLQSSKVQNETIPDTFIGQSFIAGDCLICGKKTRFFYSEVALWRESLNCQHCRSTSRYRSIAHGLLLAIEELAGQKATSLAALPHTNNMQLNVYDTQPPFYYEPCAYPLPDLLKSNKWIDVQLSQFKPELKLGKILASGVSNQNLECLTYPDASLDIVITSDVMEHVRLDEQAHREIYRVLKPGGIYIFTVPHDRSWEATLIRVQITNPEDPSMDLHLLEPEYHGDTNSDDDKGVLAYRTYGRDLEVFLDGLGFEVSYTKDDIPDKGIMSTELYFCRKQV